MSVRASRLLFILNLQYIVWGWKQVHSTYIVVKLVEHLLLAHTQTHQSLIIPYSCLLFVLIYLIFMNDIFNDNKLGNIRKLIILRSLACAQNLTYSKIFMQTAITANYHQLSFSINRLREREKTTPRQLIVIPWNNKMINKVQLVGAGRRLNINM